MDNDTKLLVSLGTTGALIGLGKALASTKPAGWKVVTARVITTAGLSMSAAFFTVILPGLSYTASVGLAAAFATLGTHALERLFQRFLGGTSGSQ